jgi:spermidine dehydrogenase
MRARPTTHTNGAARDLGLDSGITRRDFLNGSLLATGSALLTMPAPTLAHGVSDQNPSWDGYGGIGDYAKAHGNMWSTQSAGHRLRDRVYGDKALRAAVNTGEHHTLIVVGGGLSGLGAAVFLRERASGSCLVLDNHEMMGGEAKRNEFIVDDQRLIGPQGSNEFRAQAPSGWVGEYWRALGLPSDVDGFMFQEWAPGIEPLPIARENYYFQIWNDEFRSHGFFFRQPDGSLRLVKDAFATGFSETPWSESLRRDFMRWRASPQVYAGPDLARWLDGMTYEELIVRELKLDAAVARYADPIIAAGAGGLGSDVISAQLAAQIGLPGTSNGDPNARRSRKLSDAVSLAISFPGGNDGIMRHVLKKLVPQAIAGEGFDGILNGRIRFDALDQSDNSTRIRLAATAIRVTNLKDGHVEVIYEKQGRLWRTTADAVVMANGAWNSQYIVADVGDAQRQAFQDFVRAPMLVVNVALRRWRFMYEMGITAASYRDQFGFSCNIRQPMLVGDYRPPLHPDKPTILTFYVPFERPGNALKVQAAAARGELLGTSYRDYELKIRAQMVRLFARGGFDARKDIAGIILNRWGHAYVCPAPGFYFGRGGKPAAPDVLRQVVGRVAFANAELHGHQNWIDATAEGRRAVEQLFG